MTYADAKRAIDRLYRSHPGIASFVVKDVQYNEITRDKVLSVCRKGGIESDPASRESVRVAGCAPLVYFFYEYGRQRSAPDSIAVARKLYWYAVASIRGPFSARDTLSGLLQSWGIP